MSNVAIAYAGKHPVPVAIGVVVVGLVILWVFGAFKGGAAAPSDGSASAAGFFAAQAAQAQSGNEVQLAGIVTGAQTAQAQIASTTSITNNSTWANTQSNEALNDNQFQLNLGELALDKQLNSQVTLNAMDQHALNVLSFGGLPAYQALTASGYYASHG